jgi:hypothetical protein
MSFRSLVSSVILIAISSSLSACFSSSEVSNKNEASVGQQLLDLDRAHSQGIITEKEYAKLKKVIIKKND